MSNFRRYLDKQVEVALSGNHMYTGKLIDLGADLLVLLHERRYYYIPIVHVQSIQERTASSEETGQVVPEEPLEYPSESLSLRQILFQAKGQSVELYVTGKRTIHGYITAIMNDYFIFFSPIYKTMIVSMDHWRWLIPYPPGFTPYSLGSGYISTANASLARTFVEQCKNQEGSLVVLDLGDNPNKIGLLEKADSHTIELVTAKGERVCWNIRHLKTIATP